MTEGIEDALREHVEHVRDVLEHVRDDLEQVREDAQLVLRDNPYLLPVAAGAVGLGVGVLIGSRLARRLLLVAAGAIVSDAIGGEVKRLAGDFMHDVERGLGPRLEHPHPGQRERQRQHEREAATKAGPQA